MPSASPARSVFVAGHAGLVGSAITRALVGRSDVNIVRRKRIDLDLEDQAAVNALFSSERIELVILAAARVGGIVANSTYPADFIRSNLAIQCNVIDAAWRAGVQDLLFLGSSCVYPKFATQPIAETELLAGALEPTNSAYAVAKIAGIEMCRAYNNQFGTNYLSVMPTNLYGPGDNFDLQSSHVLPALIRKFDEAKSRLDESVTLWGSGTPRREFLHVDDMADACLLVVDKHRGNDLINIGCGEDIAIRDLAELVREIVGYKGSIRWDASKPDGTPRKLLDVSRLSSLGWKPRISLPDGIEATYSWYLKNRPRLVSE
jgi:GDP-L-fucose synthase